MQLELVTEGGGRVWTAEELAALAEGGRIAVAEVLSTESAAFATFEAEDGSYRACIPFEVAARQGYLFLEGGTLRLRVEDGSTLCWNVKDVALIRLSEEKLPDSVPENPPH